MAANPNRFAAGFSEEDQEATLRAFNRLHRAEFETRWREHNYVAIFEEFDAEGSYFNDLHADSSHAYYFLTEGKNPIAVCTIETEEQLRTAIYAALELQHLEFRQLYTLEEWEKVQEKKERAALEEYAGELCRRYRCDVNSLEFMEAMDQEESRFSTYREGMREDGLCIGYGVTSEQWFDEFNASQGDTAKVERMREYVRKYLPLLYARWQQAKVEG